MRNYFYFLTLLSALLLPAFRGTAQCPTSTISGASAINIGNTTTFTPSSLPTGGTVTTVNGYRIHRFTSSGTFTVPAGFSGSVEMLVVGGGGGGGGRTYTSSGFGNGGSGVGGKGGALVSPAAYRYKIIPAEAGTFGFEINQNGKPLIRQTTVPGLPGNKGFAAKTDAAKVAELMITKLKRGEMPPSVTMEELKKLKILK